MQQWNVVRSWMQQPLTVVLGVIAGAGAAKSGHGDWAALGIAAVVPLYAGSIVAFTAVKQLRRRDR
jgi:hypothetical protein